MGILSTVLKVVGVVAAVASGGILAGAVIALASFAGGSVGKFFHSGWGKALTYAVAAAGAYSSIASAAGTGAAEQAGTTSGFLDNFVSGAKSFVSALAHPIDTVESLFGAGGTADLGTSGAAAGETSSNLAANASQAAATQTADTAAAVGDTGAAGAAAADTPINEIAQGATSSASTAGGTSTNFEGADVGATPGSTADVQNATNAATANTDAATAQSQANVNAGLYAGNSSSNATGGGGSLLSRAAKFASTPGGGQMLGQIVQGIGNGMSQNSLIQKEIAAQNWANLQWRNPQLTQQVQAAAAQPITVPTGYLSRANAVADMMNGKPTTGPLMGPQPGGGPGPGGTGTPMPQMPVRAGGT